MIKLDKVFFLVFIILFATIGCDDVFEEDISEDEVRLLSPTDSQLVEGNFVMFQWEDIEGSTGFRVQVTNDMSQLVNDTLVSNTNLILPLSSGFYTWRARAENFAYTTEYSAYQSFTLITSDDLSNQMVFLIGPEDNFYSVSESILLQWGENAFADYYIFELQQTLNGQTTTVLYDDNVLDTTYQLDASTLSDDAVYTWKIKGVNSFSETDFNSRKIFIDNTVPGIPNLVAPEVNFSANVSNTVEFSWELPEDTGEIQSDVRSILEISNNADFSDLEGIFETDETSESLIFDTSGNYYWRVKLMDKAGNIGDYSDIRDINIQ